MTPNCPACGEPLSGSPAGASPTMTCPACGHTMSTAYLAETVELGTWHAWAGERLAWLHDRLLAGDLPVQGQVSPTPPSADPAPDFLASPARAPEHPPRPPASAGSLLLAAGAFLLVVAGIAFIAFTWNLLGPFGQISLLLIIGVACMASAVRLATRLHGTSVAIGVVGALLVTIAAIGARTLGPDLIGAGASLLVALAIALALCATAVWLQPRIAPIAELAGSVGAVTVMVFLATAPVDEALPLAEPWSWWVALSCGVGSVVLLLLADRVRLSSWPWTASAFLFVAATSFALFVPETTEDATVSSVEPVIAALTLVIASVGVALLRRSTGHVWPVTVAALAVWFLALAIAWVSGVSAPEVRLWAALVLAAAGAVALVPNLLVVGPRGFQRAVSLAGASAIGAAVGLAVAPWLDPRLNYLTTESWAVQAWPAWRGLAAGLAFVALLLASAAVTPRVLGAPSVVEDKPPRPASIRGLAPLVSPAVALATWLFVSSSDVGESTADQRDYLDPYQTQPVPDAYQHQVAVALTVLACGLLAMALLRRLPALAVWTVPVLTIPAALLELSTLSLDPTVEPEVYGLALGIATLVASAGWWWLRRPEHTPSWQTVAPPFVLAAAPSTLALLGETAQRWWHGEDPSTGYQVRMVTLLLIGAVAAVVGARQRWSGLFFPGLALVAVVVGIQLVDLGRFLPQWVSFAVAGAVLIAAGARWEVVRQQGTASANWVRSLT